MKVRKKPVVVEAVRWTGRNQEEVEQFCGKSCWFQPSALEASGVGLAIDAADGLRVVQSGHYVIRGVAGDLYPCAPGTFEATYEIVEDPLYSAKPAFVGGNPTVVFDFDGVIHSYSSGWRGVDVVPDPPVPGIGDAIKEIRAAGYRVVVVSTRCSTQPGYLAVAHYLTDHGIEVDAVQAEKPPALVYIDDRAICFDGHPRNLLLQIRSFTPWTARAKG